MSDSEIDKAVKEAAEFEAQDKKRKEAIDTKNNADSMVFQVENALKEAGDKLDANDKAAVEADLNALKDILAKYTNTEDLGRCSGCRDQSSSGEDDGKCSEAFRKDV